MSRINRFTKLTFTLHSWLGLVSGIFLLLLGLSGSAIVFYKEIDQFLHADLLRVEPAGKPLPLDVLYRKICDDYPRLAGIAWLNPDAAAMQAYEFRLYQNDGQLRTYDLGLISLDPYSGKTLRQGHLKDLNPSFLHWLVQFHWSFQLGIPGLLLATIFGLTMLLSTVTGLVIYRKFIGKVLLFRVKIKWDNWRTISSGLHRVVGVWALLFNIVIFFTGFWMNMFALDPRYWQKQTQPSPVNTLAVQSLDAMLQTAKRSMPDLILKNVYLPTQPDKNFRVSGTVSDQSAFFYQGNTVSIDPVTGVILTQERLADKDFWTKLEATFFPLHVGSFGGVPTKIIYMVVGLLPGLLSCTGALLWWRKIRKKYY